MNFQLLNNRQRKEIFSAGLRLLEETGLLIKSEEAKRSLLEAGAKVAGDRLLLPENLVRKSLSAAPKEFSIRGEKKGSELRPGAGRTVFGLEIAGLGSFGDSHELNRNEGTIGIVDLIELTNGLSNLEFIKITQGSFRNEAGESGFELLEKAVKATNKPAVLDTSGAIACEEAFNFFNKPTKPERDEKQRTPSTLYSLGSDEPLVKSGKWIEQLNVCAKNRVPVLFEPELLSGEELSGKISRKITLGLTDWLGSITLTQILQPGCQVVLSTSLTESEHRGKEFSPGAGFSNALTSGLVEMADYLRVPVLASNAGNPLSWLDQKTRLGSTLGFLVDSLAGADLVSSRVRPKRSGGYPSGVPVITDEIAGMVKRVTRDVSTNKDDLAVDLIGRIGPKGNYLTEKHTLERFKTEHWHPSIMDRQSFESWFSDGGKDLTERATERAKAILDDNEETTPSEGTGENTIDPHDN